MPSCERERFSQSATMLIETQLNLKKTAQHNRLLSLSYSTEAKMKYESG